MAKIGIALQYRNHIFVCIGSFIIYLCFFNKKGASQGASFLCIGAKRGIGFVVKKLQTIKK